MTLLEAYNNWVQARPFRQKIEPRLVSYYEDGIEKSFMEPAHYDGHCCLSWHFYNQREANGMIKNLPKEDMDVCPRERAWRIYVQIRDDLLRGLVH